MDWVSVTSFQGPAGGSNRTTWVLDLEWHLSHLEGVTAPVVRPPPELGPGEPKNLHLIKVPSDADAAGELQHRAAMATRVHCGPPGPPPGHGLDYRGF